MVLGQRVRHHGHVAQLGHQRHLGLNPIFHVQVGGTPTAPVERGRAGDAAVLHMLEQGFERRKAGARGQKYQGLVGVFAQKERSERAFDAQNVFFLHGAEHQIGKASAGHVADMQLQRRAGVRCVGHGVAAPRAVTHDELNVLAGAVSKTVVGGQLQLHDHHIGRFFDHAADAGGHLFDGQCARRGDLARFQHDVALGGGAAGQHEIGGFFFNTQGFALEIGLDHTA